MGVGAGIQFERATCHSNGKLNNRDSRLGAGGGGVVVVGGEWGG